MEQFKSRSTSIPSGESSVLVDATERHLADAIVQLAKEVPQRSIGKVGLHPIPAETTWPLRWLRYLFLESRQRYLSVICLIDTAAGSDACNVNDFVTGNENDFIEEV
jgi:hypothetical protein